MCVCVCILTLGYKSGKVKHRDMKCCLKKTIPLINPVDLNMLTSFTTERDPDGPFTWQTKTASYRKLDMDYDLTD